MKSRADISVDELLHSPHAHCVVPNASKMAKRPRTDSAPAPPIDGSTPESSASPPQMTASSTAADEQAGPGHNAKYTHVEHRRSQGSKTVMKCFLPPHKPAFFDSYEAYEVHYQKNHVNRCLECAKNFPTEHYLGLHIAENHDPLNDALRERGEKTVSLHRLFTSATSITLCPL